MTNLQDRYFAVRARTESLCEPLEIEDYCMQPIPEVSPPKWHLAHTTWFFENLVLANFCEGYAPYNAQYNYIFNSYYQSFGSRVQRDTRGTLSRPTTEQVYEYRKVIDSRMGEFFTSQKLQDPDVRAVIELGLQHEQQHQELLLADIQYVFWHNPLKPRYLSGEKPRALVSELSRWVSFSASQFCVGAPKDTTTFVYDNEQPQHQVYVNDFSLQSRCITNGDYLAFVEAGGYDDFRLWFDDGWTWRQRNEVAHPLYWQREKDDWAEFSLFGLSELDPHQPVSHISYYEASAYALWAGVRLPTEFEWEHACADTPDARALFLESGRYAPADIGDDDLANLFGSTWEWTQSAYMPYPGYQPFSGALSEYNGKFMANQMVLRGGSYATSQQHIRKTYRNFFYPHDRWQVAGFRLARSDGA